MSYLLPCLAMMLLVSFRFSVAQIFHELKCTVYGNQDLLMYSNQDLLSQRETDLSPSLAVSGFWLFPASPNLSPVCRTNGATRERIWARTALMEVLGKWHKHSRFKDELNFLNKLRSKLLHKWMCKSLSCCRLQNTIHFVWVSSKKCVVIVQRRLGGREGGGR